MLTCPFRIAQISRVFSNILAEGTVWSILALSTETQYLTIPSFTPTKHCPPFHAPSTPYPCHSLFILFFCILWVPIQWKSLSCVWLFATPWAIQSMEFSRGQNIGVGSFSPLQGIFPTQGSNPCLWHHRKILYQLSHKESPRILEWAACPFSCRSSRPRNWNRGLLHCRRILYQLSYQGSPISPTKYVSLKRQIQSFCPKSNHCSTLQILEDT